MTDKTITLGSLFSGSGGFELGGLLNGITPLWASEVEPFPIRVTTKRLPGVKHYGDINEINGAEVPPVDIITGGFCCQDLSVAGKRAGLHGERSGLFFQIIRIIKEMRQATGNAYPKFAVLENVPGMYSSAGGADFLEVLNELIKIKDETLSIPMPENGKWSTAGFIVGDGFSLGWRTFDAQFWGVPQRRRRCYLVLDLTSECVENILFNETRLRGNPPQGFFTRETTAGDIADCLGGTGCIGFEPGASSRLGGHVWDESVGALRAHAGDNQTAVAIPINEQVGLRPHKDGDGTGLGVGVDGDPAYTIQANHPHCVALENHPADSRIKICENDVAQCLSSRMGTGGNNTPMVMEEAAPRTLIIRSGKPGGGKGPLVQDNLSATISTHNNQTLFEPKLYGIDSQNSNSMKSSNVHSGIHEMDASRTLDTGACSGNGGQVVVAFAQNQRDEVRDLRDCAGALAAEPGMKQQTFVAQENPCYALEGNGQRPSHKGSGVSEDVSPTLNSVEQHQVAYAMTTGCYTQVCEEKTPTLQARDYKDAPIVNFPAYGIDRAAFNQGKNAQYNPSVNEEQSPTIVAKGPGAVALPARTRYIVRRLTPTECALLQGFPPHWCAGLETPEPTEEDIAFWSEVWETHRIIVGKSTKPKSRNQIIKWLKDPYSDAAEYKMWGNGVSLPIPVFVLSGIVYYAS